MSKKKKVRQELDMAEHSAKLRAIPSNHWDFVRRWFVLLVAGVLLFGLGWLALGR